jgi:hypothetical protein
MSSKFWLPIPKTSYDQFRRFAAEIRRRFRKNIARNLLDFGAEQSVAVTPVS